MGMRVRAQPLCALAWTSYPLVCPLRQVSRPPEKTDATLASAQWNELPQAPQALGRQMESRRGCLYCEPHLSKTPVGTVSCPLSGPFLCFIPGIQSIQLSAKGQGRHLMVGLLTCIALPLPGVLSPRRVALRKASADTLGSDPWRNFGFALQLWKAEISWLQRLFCHSKKYGLGRLVQRGTD